MKRIWKYYHFIIFFFAVYCFLMQVLSWLPLLKKSKAIITKNPECLAIGRDILATSKNAMDAALGILACEAIQSPNLAGFGGGFIALVRRGDKVRTLDAFAAAPTYLDNYNYSRKHPANMIGVPGYVKGMDELHREYGVLPMATILEQPLRLAKGRALNPSYGRHKKYDAAINKEFNGSYLVDYGKLAESIEMLKDNGLNDFYHGKFAEILASDITEIWGSFTLKDLQAYK